jgi:hypothetical protein
VEKIITKNTFVTARVRNVGFMLSANLYNYKLSQNDLTSSAVAYKTRAKIVVNKLKTIAGLMLQPLLPSKIIPYLN